LTTRTLTRREALQLFLALAGSGSLLRPGTLISAELLPRRSALSTPALREFLNEAAETILPATPESPGAKAADVGGFMIFYARECFDPAQADLFASIPEALDSASAARFAGAKFLALSAGQRLELFSNLQAQKPAAQFYALLKELSVFGYFTSEIGMKQALRHLAVPGRYEGCIDVQPGVKAWVD
jgi:hypothetical protein